MALRYVVANLLSGASLTVTNEDALFPKAKAIDGVPGSVFKFASDGTNRDVVADTGNDIPNGDFEAAFVGGLPTAAWGKSAGATLTRSTSSPFDGAACLRVTGGLTEDGYIDVTVRPGERLQLDGAGSGDVTNPWRFKVRNLWTGKELNSSAAWVSSAFITGSAAADWGPLLAGPFQVEHPAGSPETVVLRFEFYGSSVGSGLGYDSLVLTSAANFAAIIDHNIVRGAAAPVVAWSLDGSSFTTAGTLPITAPCAYVTFSTIYARHWRFRVPVENGTPVSYGELVVGYAETAGRAQDYGWQLDHVDHQVRHALPFGGEAVYRLPGFPQRRLSLSLKPSAEAEWLEVLDTLWRATHGGALPVVIVPWDAEPTVIHGRLRATLPSARELMTRWNTSLEVMESAHPLVTGG